MRMHRYGGRENGLMIIGSPQELIALGRALLSAGDSASQDWPERVAETTVDGAQDFLVSFHIDTVKSDKPKTNFP